MSNAEKLVFNKNNENNFNTIAFGYNFINYQHIKLFLLSIYYNIITVKQSLVDLSGNNIKKLEYFFEKKKHKAEDIDRHTLHKNRLKKSIYILFTLLGIISLNSVILTLYFTKIISGETYSRILQTYLFFSILLGFIILPYHPKHYGFNLNKLSYNIKWGIAFSFIFVTLNLIYRYKQVSQGNTYFTFNLNNYTLIWGLLYYPLVVIIQETMIKGFLQSYFYAIFDFHKHNKLIAITISSALFAQFHIFSGFTIALGTFVFAFITGLFYEKTRSLTGSCLIHYLAGIALFFGTMMF